MFHNSLQWFLFCRVHGLQFVDFQVAMNYVSIADVARGRQDFIAPADKPPRAATLEGTTRFRRVTIDDVVGYQLRRRIGVGLQDGAE